MSKPKNSIVGFVEMKDAAREPITPELRELYEDLKYEGLPWFKRLFKPSPQKERDAWKENTYLLRRCLEYFRDREDSDA